MHFAHVNSISKCEYTGGTKTNPTEWGKDRKARRSERSPSIGGQTYTYWNGGVAVLETIAYRPSAAAVRHFTAALAWRRVVSKGDRLRPFAPHKRLPCTRTGSACAVTR